MIDAMMRDAHFILYVWQVAWILFVAVSVSAFLLAGLAIRTRRKQ